MAWSGYFMFDGTEIVNTARTVAYAKSYGLTWLRCEGNDALGPMLGETYVAPLTDDPPWFDPDLSDSLDFYGAYPLQVTGLEDSTVTATVTESLLDGGVVNRPRRGTRTMVFSLGLVGSTECGVEYGLRWLRTALSGQPCQGVVDCTGSDLCYLSCEPFLDYGSDVVDLNACLAPLLRNLHKVTTTTGPIVTAKYAMPSGGHVWTVTFTLVAGDPYEFMTERPLVEGFPSDPTFYVNPLYPPVAPPHPWSNTAGVTTTEYNCVVPTYRPLYDPDCPLVTSPPGVPNVPVSCFDFPESFTRRFFTIPKEEIPLWGSSVPIITLRTGATEVRNLRLRFYADVMETGNPDFDPCAYCGDIVFSFIPAGSTMVFDGTQRRVTVQTPGQQNRRADAVVFKSDGTPFDWPELSCGFGYLAVVDLPDAALAPTMDLTLVGKVI